MTEAGRLTCVAVKHARDAFVDQPTIDAQWRQLRFGAPPHFERAIAESEALIDLIAASGASVLCLPHDRTTTLDSIYVRDASIVTPRGVILGNMGKRERAAEPGAQQAAFAQLSELPVIGAIHEPGRLEGGDLIWLDDRTVVVGRGYRTNDEGVRQLRALVEPEVEIVTVPLPHWRGPDDVMHLMSLISPVDRNLAVVYPPLLPVPFREWLLQRDIELVAVPDEEFETMGANVLALAPRRCLMIERNPRTRAALERAGATVVEYQGEEISIKGAGGPTCLTRPLKRAPV